MRSSYAFTNIRPALVLSFRAGEDKPGGFEGMKGAASAAFAVIVDLVADGVKVGESTFNFRLKLYRRLPLTVRSYAVIRAINAPI